MTPSKLNGHGGIDLTRRTVLKAAALAGLTAGSTTAAAAASHPPGGDVTRAANSPSTYPDVIPLPNGFQPEGIATGNGDVFFVGSLDTGVIYRGRLRTGEGAVLTDPVAGRVAVGLSHDARTNALFVAGGATGAAYVYHAGNGEPLGDYELTPAGSFVNDVVVTRQAAYFTDSFRPVYYRVPLAPDGALPEQSAVEEVSLGGDFQFVSGFNANGIDATPDGKHLFVVNSSTGLLYRVAPASGEATEVDLGGDTLPNGDGILLDGRTLFVVQNQLDQIAVVQLAPDGTAGDLLGVITDDAFDVPTTVAAFGNALYAVNARFGVADPGNADYDVVRVSKEADS